MSAIPLEPIWIDSDSELRDLCQRWQQQPAIAVDTEFMRSDTFYPRTALIQVGDGQGCYLIDPLSIKNFDCFRKLMLDANVTKVFHSCSEDLEVFQTFLNLVPSPVFDTQLAAAIAGYDFSLGYAKLVHQLLGVEITKNETRSDWEQRPLSQAQLQYAAMDVGYLLVVYGVLLKKLRQQERLEWVQEDCAQLISDYRSPVDEAQLYRKIKQAWKLNRQQLAVLQALVAWREQQAKDRDLPRNRVVKERALWDMARYQPTAVRQLRGLEGMTGRMVERDGETLLNLIATSSVSDPADQPPFLPPPLSPSQGELLKHLKQEVRSCAQKLEVVPEILVKKRDYEELIRSGLENNDYSLNQRLSGWRKSVIGDPLLAAINRGRR